MSKGEIAQLLERNHRGINRAASVGAGKALAQILERAQEDLATRVRAAHRRGLDERFTGVQLHAARAQVMDAIRQLKAAVGEHVSDRARAAAERGLRDTLAVLKAAEREFSGVVRPLALEQALRFDARLNGVRATLLRQHATSVDRYGVRMISQFERLMQTSVVNRYTVGTLIDMLVGKKGPRGNGVSLRAIVLPDGSVKRTLTGDFPDGLFVDNRYWAERIVRTEMMYSYNAATQAGIEEEAATDFPDMKRIILAYFDQRTAADSLYVHGEIRGIDEPFEDGAGRVYLFPPARPNDREIVSAWREAWPTLRELEQLPKAERRAAQAEASAEGD